MKKEAVMKTISWMLSLAIVLMSPGLNCWAEMSETFHQIPTGVEIVPTGLNAQMQSIGEGSMQNFLSKDLLSVSANDVLEKTEGPSFRRKPESSKSKILDLGVQIAAVTKAEQAAGAGVTNNKISGFKAILAHHAARGIQAIQKFHQAVLNHIANWSSLFDGLSLHPALAGTSFSVIPAKAGIQNLYSGLRLMNRRSDEPNDSAQISQPQAEPAVPAPDNLDSASRGVWVTLSRYHFFPSPLPNPDELEKLFGAKIISKIYSPSDNPQSPFASPAAYDLILPDQNYDAFHRHYWMRFSIASERIPKPVAGTTLGIVKRMVGESLGILISEDGEERVFRFGQIVNYRGETAKEMGLKEETLVRLTLQDDKVKEIFIPGFSDRETDIQYPKTPNSGADNGSKAEPSVAGHPADPRTPTPPAPMDISWGRFFAGMGAAVVGAVALSVSAAGLALWYGPQVLWYGYGEILTNKNLGLRYKLGYGALLLPAVPLLMAASPIVGMFYGLIRGFGKAAQSGFTAAVKDINSTARDAVHQLNNARLQAQATIARQKAEPRPSNAADISLKALAKGVAGSALSLVSIPIPAFGVILWQSHRVLYYGLKALWKTQTIGLRYKLALSLLAPATYVLVNALALPVTMVYALGEGFMRGKDLGSMAAFAKGSDDVRTLNRNINALVDSLKNSIESSAAPTNTAPMTPNSGSASNGAIIAAELEYSKTAGAKAEPVSVSGRATAAGGIVPVISDDGHSISLRDAKTGEELRRLDLPSFWVTFAATIKGGKEIVIVDSMEDGQAVVLDAQNGKIIRAFKGPNVGFWSKAVSADGHYLFAGQHDRRQAAMWNIETGKREMVFASPVTKIMGNFWDALIMRAAMSTALSPDGNIVYVGEHWGAHYGASVSAWNRFTGKILWRMDVPDADGWIHALSVSSDGRRLSITPEIGRYPFTMDIPPQNQKSEKAAVKGKIIAVIAGLAIGTLALALMPHLAPAATLMAAPAAAHAATLAAAGVGGTLASNVDVLMGAGVGVIVGVIAAAFLANRIFPKTYGGNAKVALVFLAPVFGAIGAVVGAFIGFFVGLFI